MIPLIRGELTVRLPVSALRSSAPGGRVSPSSNRISSNSVSRAYFNPRDSAGDREVHIRASLFLLFPGAQMGFHPFVGDKGAQDHDEEGGGDHEIPVGRGVYLVLRVDEMGRLGADARHQRIQRPDDQIGAVAAGHTGKKRLPDPPTGAARRRETPALR